MANQNEVAKIIEFIEQEYRARPEFLWARTPENAIFRHTVNRKWFAILLVNLSREKLGLSGEGKIDILNLKCEPGLIEMLVDGKKFLPGYHMNKEHWISIPLDGSVRLEEIAPLVEMSYKLTS